MEGNINEIIDYYARANVSFAGVFIENQKADRSSIHRRTNPHCGGLAIPLGGNARFILNGTVYALQPGTVVHAGPDMQLDIESLGDNHLRLAVVHYTIPGGEADRFPLFRKHFSFPSEDSAKLSTLVQQLLRQQSTPGNSAMFKVKLLFITLLGELFEGAKRHLATSDTVLVEQIMEYMHQNYAEPLSIAQIAASFKLDRRRLAELFERHGEMTPSNYLIECRILKAKELLQTCDCSIKQVAECVGYSDSLYFSRAFKKQIGMAPTEYREYVKSSI